MAMSSSNRHKVCYCVDNDNSLRFFFSKIKERQEAVKALLANSDGHCIYTLSDILRKTPDLEKLLCACYQYKVTYVSS